MRTTGESELIFCKVTDTVTLDFPEITIG